MDNFPCNSHLWTANAYRSWISKKEALIITCKNLNYPFQNFSDKLLVDKLWSASPIDLFARDLLDVVCEKNCDWNTFILQNENYMFSTKQLCRDISNLAVMSTFWFGKRRKCVKNKRLLFTESLESITARATYEKVFYHPCRRRMYDKSKKKHSVPFQQGGLSQMFFTYC